eukprot:103978-Hanusia_phi.AAC.1
MQDQEDWLACPLESLHFLPSDNSTSDLALSVNAWRSPDDDLWLLLDVPPLHGATCCASLSQCCVSELPV